ncbi:DUF948 domain-containing protein [Lactobacillus sp. DCY120]|uniref:DUF948 domain-containing protein n=1 Tax=Bombilactobacillus apium TaxID=2675299 RepID=A0A850R1X5_9LACO|nr:DUF948 domain-containing protein [Bombilactobacillus apium]NVY97129.1 DUF948 domain-containing protein [Bombilactobacillus apium]
MTLGQIAGLIAALAFVALVVFLVRLLFQLEKIVLKLQTTVEETNHTIATLTADLDQIAHQGDNTISKTNELMDDINGKVGKLDPFFQALENLGNSLAQATDKNNHRSKNQKMMQSAATMASKLALWAFKSYRKK